MIMRLRVRVRGKVLILPLLIILGHSIMFCKPYCSTDTGCSVAISRCTSCKTPYTYNSPGCVIDSTLYSNTVQYLGADTSFTSSGFSSNVVLGTATCIDTSGNSYNMLGPLTADNYIYKEFQGLGVDHFQADVFWSYGIFGGWSNEALSAIITDGNGIVTSQVPQGQQCSFDYTINGCSLNKGCFKGNQLTIPTHNTDFLSTNFSSMGSTVTGAKTWALTNLLIVLYLCQSTCATCAGPTSSDCLSCVSGLFLRGSVCISSCPYYTIPSTRTCVTSCGSYSYASSYNSFCESCPSGCPTCSSTVECMSWDEGEDLSSTAFDLLPLWITLGVLVMAILGVLFWKLCCSGKTFYDKMEQEVIDRKECKDVNQPVRRQQGASNETMEARWLDDIDELHMTKLGAKGQPSTIQGIGRTSTL